MKEAFVIFMTFLTLFLGSLAIAELFDEFKRYQSKKHKRKNIIDEFYETEKSDLRELENKK